MSLAAPLARVADAALEASVVGSFTAIGPAVRSRLEDWDDLPAMTGRQVVVTGATPGLGKQTATRLAGLGADVHIVGRSPERTEAAAAELRGVAGVGRVDHGIADLNSVTAAAEWARSFAERDRLDVLVHNAGALDNDYGEGPEGLERTVATHVVSPFVMTALLLPLLRRTGAPSRVITVSSGGCTPSGSPSIASSCTPIATTA